MRFLLLMFLLVPGLALAQDRRPSHCIALAENAPGLQYLHQANWTAPLDEYSVRISYIDHAMFLIQTQGGLSAVTDYTGFIGANDIVPTVATMNHAHESHWTSIPDDRIPHVLKGWGNGVVAADHHLDLGEMLVRNVATDIRSRWNNGVEKYGNSIFVFEVAGLCIGHLGHLHHEPDTAQYAALGRLDVVMAAVDGGMTVDLTTMTRILKRLKSSVVIPMHWWGTGTLQGFVSGMADVFDVEYLEASSLEVSLRDLPSRPTIKVLQPAYLRRTDE